MAKITVAQYLIQELSKLGIEHFFGLPGDFNFNVLYAIEENPNANWVGCTNELNAGYAADGYARTKGYGAIVTTYGVGELSAINAVAGSFAENVPVFKIAGIPATKFIENNTVLHHNFQKPNYRAFEKAYSNVVETTAYLNHSNAKEEIDRLISVFSRTNRPVYLAIPDDVCTMQIENVSKVSEAKSDSISLSKAVKHAAKMINESKNPIILADVLIKRFKAKNEFSYFMENSKIPATNLLMGGGIIDSDSENYLGTFFAYYQNPASISNLRASDCVISIGIINSDLNTFNFCLPFKTEDFIDVQGDYVIIENKKYDDVLMKDFLAELVNAVEKRNPQAKTAEIGLEVDGSNSNNPLTSKYIYARFQEFLEPNDIVFAETGIIPCGVAPLKLPKNTDFNSQSLWGSIGWATPASFGAQVAAPDRRVVVFTGEGSHQLTIQEISNFSRLGLKPIFIVLNNSGYTVERILSNHPDDAFNEIIPWNYVKLAEAFNCDIWTAQARTNIEFDTVLKQAKIEQKSRMCYIEIFTDKMDIPELSEKIMANLKRLKEKTF